jgi:hypothetical protein
LSVEIQLARWEGWNPNNRSNFASLLYLSQAIIWVSNVTYRVFPFCVQFVMWDVIVVLHHSLRFLFISNNSHFQKCTNNWHEIDIKLIDWWIDFGKLIIQGWEKLNISNRFRNTRVWVRGRDCFVNGFTTTYATSAYHD